MKSRPRLLALAVASLFATAALAQEAMPPPPPPPAPPMQPAMPPPPPASPSADQNMPMPPPPPAPPADQNMPPPPPPASAAQQAPAAGSAQMPTPQGSTLTVNSGMPPAPDYGPKPAFEQLDANHDGRITQDEAQAYPLLDNDWIHVAHHRSSISKSDYAKWDAGT